MKDKPILIGEFPISIAEVYALYAKQLGKTVKTLSDEEKRKAIALVRKWKGV